jgi:hypothetical protein
MEASLFFLIVSRRDLNGSGSKGGELVAAQTPEMTGSLFLLLVLPVTSACSFSTCLGRKRKEKEKWPCVTRFTAGQNSLAAHFFFSFSLSLFPSWTISERLFGLDCFTQVCLVASFVVH